MRYQYIPNHQTQQLYRAALNNDLGIYSVESGSGIGGFLKNIMTKFVIPIGKSVLSKGYEIAKPELHKIANKGVNAAANYGIQQIQNVRKKAQKRVGRKRRRDKLS